VTPKKRFSL